MQVFCHDLPFQVHLCCPLPLTTPGGFLARMSHALACSGRALTFMGRMRHSLPRQRMRVLWRAFHAHPCFSYLLHPGASASHTRAPAASDTGDHAVTVPVSAAAAALTAAVPSESAVTRHDDADDSDGLSSPGRARLSPALAALQPEVPFEFVTFDVIRGPIVYHLPHGQGAEEAILYALQHAPFPNPTWTHTRAHVPGFPQLQILLMRDRALCTVILDARPLG